MEENNQNREKQLYATTDEHLINQIAILLSKNGISSDRRTEGSGAYMNIYMGNTIQEKSIYVMEQDYEKAYDLILSLIPNATEEIEELEEEEEEDETVEKYKRIKRIFGMLIIGVPVLIFVILFIISIIGTILQ